MESGGRSSDERRAAAEERARARSGRGSEPPGEPTESPSPARGGSESRGEEPPGGWQPPELDDMSRHYAGPDVYGQRRLVAVLVIVGIILILFLLLGGC
jgi:hypothetical protein